MSTAPSKSGIAPLKCSPTPLLPYMVNSVAISDDAQRVVGCYYYYPYPGAATKETHGTFCVYCSDSKGNRLWSDQYYGCQGFFAVDISGDGKVAAAGGLFTDQPQFQGLLRAYDADTGQVLLDYTALQAVPGGPPPPPFLEAGRPQRFSSVSLSSDGSVLAAAADKIYVFARNGPTSFQAAPETITFKDAFNNDNLAQAVAVDPGGQWLAACDRGGNVCMAEIADGKIKTPIYRWSAPQAPIDRNNPGGPKAPIVFLSVAISRNSKCFVAGGGDFVYLFTLDRISKGLDPIPYDTFGPPGSIPVMPVATPTNPPQNVRWIAISDDADCITAVVNRTLNGEKQGSLIRLNGRMNRVWERPLPRNPNSTSLDGKAKHVAVSDGYPVGTPGSFYLFEANSGNEIWEYSTGNMNWPIAISQDGTGIAAGSDNGLLYQFAIF